MATYRLLLILEYVYYGLTNILQPAIMPVEQRFTCVAQYLYIQNEIPII
jgi:hypothetical protein